MKTILTFLMDDSGQAMSEYGLLLAGLVVVAVLVTAVLFSTIQGLFEEIVGALGAPAT